MSIINIISQLRGSRTVTDVVHSVTKCVDYLIPSDDIMVLVWHFNLTKNLNLISRF